MKLLVFICLICMALGGNAKTSSDSSVVMRFRIFYPVSKTELHEDYMNNANTLHRIQEYLKKSPQIDSITIYSYASPEGSYRLNKRLATERGKTAKEYLLKHLPAERQLPDSLFIISPTAENWQGLRELVRYQYPHADKDEVLSILDRTDITNERRKVLLKRLNGGKPWKYILQNLMPQLRYATWISVWKRIPAEQALKPTASLSKPEMPEWKPVAPPAPADSRGESVWALKTNLLYAALLSPSIEVEHRFAPHWTGHFEFAIAWWKNKDKHKYYQLTQFSPEVRYWFNSKRWWKGHYIGAFVGAGHYDLSAGKDGYKGEYMMGGLSYGYMFPIGRYLSLDAGVGLGLMNTEYEEYLPIEGHYVYQQKSRTSYFGPVKARLSLVWHWGRKLSEGGRR